MNGLEIKRGIENSLRSFGDRPMVDAATALLESLGYRSDKRLPLKPNTPANFVATFAKDKPLNPDQALLADWQSVDFVFQLTDDEVRAASGDNQQFLFDSKGTWNDAAMESYLFFAIRLVKPSYTRTELSGVTRAVNRLFPMPVMLLFRHGDTLTLAVINRRFHKHDEAKDVLEKVTLIKDIRFASPHRAHVEILHDLSFDALRETHDFTNFVTLHAAWRKTLDCSELNKRFYQQLQHWYFWALGHIRFPKDAPKDADGRDSLSLIRLLTRLIFVWFVKEKGFVPDALFDERRLAALLTGFAPRDRRQRDSVFYRAILQNLFFATLNQEPGQRGWAREGQNFMAHSLYRHRDDFAAPATALDVFKDIPFLNGGLFECLDKSEGTPDKPRYIRIDGFSRRADSQPCVPDFLFFGDGEDVDLSEFFGEKKSRPARVRGLCRILADFKFTIEENTPIEEDVALDPELLGRVFENLLAAYNPETQVTARKQTGSFYTPREIVDYMTGQALFYALREKVGDLPDVDARLRSILAHDDAPNPFNDEETSGLIAVLDSLKVLDPACGSGAFPMGVLHRLVALLAKLDPGNARWKQRQLDKAAEIPDATVRERVLADIEQAFTANELGYGRKLYLIENCLYGVDIQPIAVQITKLRFFISLVVDQREDAAAPNRGIRPLPNLETKIVAANTLIGIEKKERQGDFLTEDTAAVKKVDELRKKLSKVRDDHFLARTTKTKAKCREQDATLRQEMSGLLQAAGLSAAWSRQLAAWDPYDQNAHAEFFDAEWMFGLAEGFGVVIGNPPYLNVELVAAEQKDYFAARYETFYKRFDVFGLFFECSLCQLARSGIVAFIIPAQIFNNLSYKKLRDLMLSNRWLQEVLYLGDKIFIAANNDVCVLFLNTAGVSSIRLVDALDFENPSVTVVAPSHFAQFGGVISVSSSAGADDIASKVFRPGAARVRQQFEVFQGVVTGNNPVFLPEPDQIVDAKLEKKLLHLVLHGRDFEKWHIHNTSRRILYVDSDTDLKKFPNAERWLLQHRNELKTRRECVNGVIAWYSLQWPRKKELLDVVPKIAVQATRNPRIKTRIVAALDEEGCYGTQGLNFIVPTTDGVSVKALLAFLNSSLVNWLFRTRFLNVAIKAEYLKDLPLPPLNAQQTKQLITLVDRILAAKRANANADTSALEREIDQHVYALYGLTPEEIQIVEGAGTAAAAPAPEPV